MATRKRAPGGGRKPKRGPTRTSSLTVRVPDYLRSHLLAAAKDHDRNISQELVSRLDASFEREQIQNLDPASGALSYLISELAGHLRVMRDWSRTPFLYQAFQEGVAALLVGLSLDSGKEPNLAPVLEAYRAGIKRSAATINEGQPLKMAGGSSLDKWIDMQVADLAERWKTPEAAGIDAARSVLAAYHGLSRGQKQVYDAMLEDEEQGRIPADDWFYKAAVERAKDVDQRMAQARRALRASGPLKQKQK